MSKISHTTFSGGLAQDEKSGLPGSARYLQSLNPYEDDNYITLNPGPSKVSGSTVVDLVLSGISAYPYATDKYFYGSEGNIYKLTALGVWSVDRTVTFANGFDLGVLSDYLYYARTTSIGRKGLLSGTPSYDDNFIETLDLDIDLDTSGGTFSNTYTTPASITETAANLQEFTPSTDPLKQIDVFINTKGTGTVTITVHDEVNTVIGTAALATGDITGSAYNSFEFATPLRVTPGKTYHFHATSTVTDTTLDTATNADMSDSNYKTRFGILINSLLHPIIQHTNGVRGTLLFGNSNYIAEWDDISYQPNRVVLPPGFEVRGFFKDQEFVVAYCTRGAEIHEFEVSMLFYWDGISPYYNYAREVTGGAIHAATNNKSRTFATQGQHAKLTVGTDPFNTLQKPPRIERNTSVEVFPNAMKNWRGRVVYGISDASGSSSVPLGIYEFGSDTDRDTGENPGEVLNLGFIASHGVVTGTNVNYGMVLPLGDEMYISWENNGAYGVDRVRPDGNPASSGIWESLITDEVSPGVHAPEKEKTALRVVVTFDALPSGATVKAKFKKNRETTGGTDNDGWTDSPAAIEGDTRVELYLGTRYKEGEYGFEVAATTNYPKIRSITFFYDANKRETDEQ